MDHVYSGQVHFCVFSYTSLYESMLEFMLGWVYMCGTIIRVRK